MPDKQPSPPNLILYRHSPQGIKTRRIPVEKRPNHIQITKTLKLRFCRQVKIRGGIKRDRLQQITFFRRWSGLGSQVGTSWAALKASVFVEKKLVQMGVVG